MLYWFGKIVIVPFFYLLFRPVIRHRERLRSKGPVMYLCNHFSLADAVALAAISAAATMVFPVPTSPWRRRFIGWGESISVSPSSRAVF